jgi:uncharacterized damage-inducible protein DinB
MNKNDIQLLYKYNAWANARILNTTSKVTLDQFIAPATFPHGGLRGTLTHVLSAEWIWRSRWEGTSPTQLIKPEDFGTFESLCNRWQEEERKLMAFVENVTEEDLQKDFDYKTTRGDPKRNILWQVMAHVVNHGTQHRSEAAALLTDFGHSPGDIDLIVFLREEK